MNLCRNFKLSFIRIRTNLSGLIPRILWTLIVILNIASDSKASANISPLDFSTVIAPNQISLSKSKGIISILFALKITNTSDKDILINKYDTPIPHLILSSGEKLETYWGVNGYVAPELSDFVYVSPNHSIYIPVACSLEKIHNKWTMRGELRNSGFWKVDGIEGTSYTVYLDYQPDPSKFSEALKPKFRNILPWSGGAKSAPSKLSLSP